MTRTVYTIDDIGGALSWSSLAAFIKYLGTDSALAKDLGKSTGWEETIKTNAILADIFDMLQTLNNNLVNFGSGGKTRKKTKPYPRPGRADDKKRTIGKGAMPLPKLREWMEDKRNGKR